MSRKVAVFLPWDASPREIRDILIELHKNLGDKRIAITNPDFLEPQVTQNNSYQYYKAIYSIESQPDSKVEIHVFPNTPKGMPTDLEGYEDAKRLAIRSPSTTQETIIEEIKKDFLPKEKTTTTVPARPAMRVMTDIKIKEYMVKDIKAYLDKVNPEVDIEKGTIKSKGIFGFKDSTEDKLDNYLKSQKSHYTVTANNHGLKGKFDKLMQEAKEQAKLEYIFSKQEEAIKVKAISALDEVKKIFPTGYGINATDQEGFTAAVCNLYAMHLKNSIGLAMNNPIIRTNVAKHAALEMAKYLIVNHMSDVGKKEKFYETIEILVKNIYFEGSTPGKSAKESDADWQKRQKTENKTITEITTQAIAMAETVDLLKKIKDDLVERSKTYLVEKAQMQENGSIKFPTDFDAFTSKTQTDIINSTFSKQDVQLISKETLDAHLEESKQAAIKASTEILITKAVSQEAIDLGGTQKYSGTELPGVELQTLNKFSSTSSVRGIDQLQFSQISEHPTLSSDDVEMRDLSTQHRILHATQTIINEIENTAKQTNASSFRAPPIDRELIKSLADILKSASSVESKCSEIRDLLIANPPTPGLVADTFIRHGLLNRTDNKPSALFDAIQPATATSQPTRSA